MGSALWLLALAAARAEEELECAAMRPRELRRFLDERGLACDGCAEKADLVAMCEANKDAPQKARPSEPSEGGGEPKGEKNIEDILASLKGMPGMEGIKMFTVWQEALVEAWLLGMPAT